MGGRSDEVADRLVDMSKQAKYVVSADVRGNLEEYASMLAHCYCNAFKLPGRGDGRTRLPPQSVGVVSIQAIYPRLTPN